MIATVLMKPDVYFRGQNHAFLSQIHLKGQDNTIFSQDLFIKFPAI